MVPAPGLVEISPAPPSVSAEPNTAIAGSPKRIADVAVAVQDPPMATGWGMQLTKQAGEYLVAGELCRRGYLAATFSGNVRDYDIIAMSEEGKAFTVQVKTILGGSFQVGDARRFILIPPVGADGLQRIDGLADLRDDSIWVFVLLAGQEPAAYFVTTATDVQKIVFDGYRWNLERHGWRRPRNPHTTHHALSVSDLEPYRDNWGLIQRRLLDVTPTPVTVHAESAEVGESV